MSDRDLDPREKKFEAWMKRVEDRLTTQERRPLTGAISIDSLDAGPTAVSATRTDPLVLKGSKVWTQGVEFLGSPPGGAGLGDDALVLRDELGVIQDVKPTPFAMFFQGAGTNVATGAVGAPVTWLPGSVTSGPFVQSRMLDAVAGALVTPFDGVWRFDMIVLWQVFADTTTRLLALQLSSDGGATYNDFVDESRLNANALALWQSFSFQSNALAGYRWRLRAQHNSAGTPLACTGVRFQQTFVRAASV